MQAEELVNTEGWKKGSLEGALADGYLRLDDIMRLEERRAELTELGGSAAEEEKTCVPDQHMSRQPESEPHRMGRAAGSGYHNQKWLWRLLFSSQISIICILLAPTMTILA